MGYSRSKKAIDRVRPVLELLATKDTNLFYPSKTPVRFRDAVYAALDVVRKLPASSEDYKAFGEVRGRYIIRLKDNGVLFERREEFQYDSPIEALAAQRARIMEFPDVTDYMMAVGIMIKEKAQEFIFSNIILSMEDEVRLARWCEANEYKIQTTLPLRITKNNASTENSQPVEG